MKKLIRQLIEKTPVITDGAWGTQLQARGLAPGECPEEWNLSHPEAVEVVARGYAQAGSQIILTNTFGANRISLEGRHLADRVAEINRAAVEISRRTAEVGARLGHALGRDLGRAMVFASMGPCGKMLITGDVEEKALAAAFEEQAQALALAGADGVVIETMADLAEAKLALAAAKKTGLPVVVSMVFDSGKGHDRTMMGTPPEQAARELTEAGADVIGANCGQGISGFVSLCARLRSSTDLPIWVKPNAGLPVIENGKTVYKTSAREFASHAPALVRAGANFIGGCCGTHPEFIQALTGGKFRIQN